MLRHDVDIIVDGYKDNGHYDKSSVFFLYVQHFLKIMKPEKDWSKRYSDFLRLGKYNFNVSRTPKRPSKSSKVFMGTYMDPTAGIRVRKGIDIELFRKCIQHSKKELMKWM